MPPGDGPVGEALMWAAVVGSGRRWLNVGASVQRWVVVVTSRCGAAKRLHRGLRAPRKDEA